MSTNALNYDNQVRRLALGVEFEDALRNQELVYPVRAEIERESPHIPPSPKYFYAFKQLGNKIPYGLLRDSSGRYSLTYFPAIQEQVDIRIYDYDRLGADGKKRELHTELAKDAIDYTVQDDYRTAYSEEENKPVVLESTRYFTTELVRLTKGISRDFSKIDSFVIYVCFEGSCRITDKCNNVVEVKQGESILIPAITQTVNIEPDEKVHLLETYVF